MTELRDLELPGVSNCCSAKVYEPDICSDCKEHCEAVEATDLETRLEQLMPPLRIRRTLYCSRCDAKKKVPPDFTSSVCQCGAKMS